MRNPRAVRRWLKKATEDLTLAQVAAKRKVGIPWAACFHAQQSAEKFLKAFLLSVHFGKS
jgi:HEPN domain-containing protein